MKLKVIILLFLMCILPLANAQVKDGKVNKITDGKYKALVHDYTYNTDSWVFKGKQNVVIDFSAEWCGPCKALSPTLEELAKEYAGKVLFYKVDIDECKELAQAYGIRSVPTMLFCPANGNTPTAITGAYPKGGNVIEVLNNKCDGIRVQIDKKTNIKTKRLRKCATSSFFVYTILLLLYKWLQPFDSFCSSNTFATIIKID